MKTAKEYLDEKYPDEGKPIPLTEELMIKLMEEYATQAKGGSGEVESAAETRFPGFDLRHRKTGFIEGAKWALNPTPPVTPQDDECDMCSELPKDGYYLGTLCPKCNRSFRSVKPTPSTHSEVGERAIKEIVGDKLSDEDRAIPEYYVLLTIEWLKLNQLTPTKPVEPHSEVGDAIDQYPDLMAYIKKRWSQIEPNVKRHDIDGFSIYRTGVEDGVELTSTKPVEMPTEGETIDLFQKNCSENIFGQDLMTEVEFKQVITKLMKGEG